MENQIYLFPRMVGFLITTFIWFVVWLATKSQDHDFTDAPHPGHVWRLQLALLTIIGIAWLLLR